MNMSSADLLGRLGRCAIVATAAIAVTVVLGVNLPAHGALVNRGNGLIYDDVLNITWLQDANYAATQYAQTGGAVGADRGLMTWTDAKDWAANLNYAGYTDWRLPHALPINGINYNFNWSYNGDTGYGFNVTSPNRELAYLYYVDLGNLPGDDTLGFPLAGGGFTKAGPFKNILTVEPGEYAGYWSGSSTQAFERPAVPILVMATGQSTILFQDTYAYTVRAWAVRDGDVALSPAVLTTVPTDTNIPTAPFGGTQVFTPTGQPVGTIDSVIGTVNLVRGGGSSVAVHSGDAIYRGDVLHTGDSSNFQLNLNDDTVYAVAPNSTLDVSADLASAPHEDAGGFMNALKTVFVYASKVVGKHDTFNQAIDLPAAGLGFRADAAKYINGNYLNPAAQLQVGSPVTLSTAVDVPDSQFTLSFKYIFTAISPEDKLEVYLDDQLIGTITGSPDDLNTFEQASFDITDPAILDLGNVKLSFKFDGTHGDKILIDDINMPGLVNGDFSTFDQAWSAAGEGSASLTATISHDGYEALLNVPEPTGLALILLGGIGVIGGRTPRRVRTR